VQTVNKAETHGYVARTCRKKIHFGAKISSNISTWKTRKRCENNTKFYLT